MWKFVGEQWCLGLSSTYINKKPTFPRISFWTGRISTFPIRTDNSFLSMKFPSRWLSTGDGRRKITEAKHIFRIQSVCFRCSFQAHIQTFQIHEPSTLKSKDIWRSYSIYYVFNPLIIPFVSNELKMPISITNNLFNWISTGLKFQHGCPTSNATKYKNE